MKYSFHQLTILVLLALIASFETFAQSISIRGTVTDAEFGDPLIGVTISVKGHPTIGTATDVDGNYTINVPGGSTLIYSYVGYNKAERKVTSSSTINIALESDNQTLDDLVVIGYGTAKKSDITGAVASVEGDKLKKIPTSSLANALQGQAAGVTVNSLSGRPGAAAEVRIRGVGTVNGAAPIYVVDGVITEDISFLPPNDIDQIEVLKDASAAAIYGSRGANGVIIVTTKGGKKNQKARITFDAYAGWQERWKKLDVMDAQEFADALVAINGNASQKKYYAEKGFNAWLNMYQGLRSSSFYPTVYDAESNPTGFDYSQVNTDWQDEIFRKGAIQNYYLNIDGGGENFTYSMSGGWFGQEGIVIGSDYSRFTGRLNTSYQATPWLKIGENISFTSSILKNTYESGDNSESAGANIISAAFAMAPWDPTRYPAGYTNRDGQDMGGLISAGSNFKNVTNPLSMIEYNHPKRRNERWFGNVFMDLTPIKYLTLHTAYNFDYVISQDRSFADAYTVSAYDKRDKNFLSRSMSRSFYWDVDNILTYAREIGNHNFSIMAGNSVEQYDYYSIGGSGSSIINPEDRNWYLSQVTDDYSKPSDGVSRNRRVSWLGRLQYGYAGKYLLTFNFRADGSSKFDEKHWGYFPSFAVAWRLGQENWMRDFTNLDDLKIRFGWGKVGNDKIGNDAFVQNMFYAGPTFVDYPFGPDGMLNHGAAVLTWINRGGHWENTEQWSVGIDGSFFHGRLTGSIDGFIRNTNDMLMYVKAPAHVGNLYDGMANVGRVKNSGIEISLEHRNTLGEFSYSVGGNISFIHNKLTDLNGGSPIYTNYGQVQVVNQGFPLYYFWGYNYDGIFRTDEEVLETYDGYTASTSPFHAGDAKYRDNNGDGVIDDKDRVMIGSSIPKYSYGINLQGFWRGFDLQIFFQGQGGNKIYNQKRHALEGNGTTSVLSPIMADAWTVDNTDGTIPNPKNSINYYVSDRFLESGAYFRLKNLQLGYTLPQKLVGKVFSQVRFYAQCANLFTITKYKGYDPEVNGGVDYGNYPQARSFIFGVNLTY